MGVRLRGVNLGGWLVLEKWMTPSLFAGLAATTRRPGAPSSAATRRRGCARTGTGFITREDFAWLAAVGHQRGAHPRRALDLRPAVSRTTRIRRRPASRSSRAGSTCSTARSTGRASSACASCSTCTRRPAARTASTTAACKDVCEWHTREEYLAHSVDVLGRLAARYRASAALHAIEVLNEPRWDVPTDLLDRLLPARLRRDPRALPRRPGRGGLPRRLPLAPRVPRLPRSRPRSRT